MVTLYDLLDVNEEASKEEIEASYKSLIVEYATNPNLSEEENKENELIISKLNMAYEILVDDEKRKKYDATLAKKKAEALLQNVSIKQEEKVPEETVVEQNPVREYEETNEIAEFSKSEEEPQEYEEEVSLTKEEQKKLRQAAQKEFNANLKKVQKAEEEYEQAYNEAYNNYLRKMGYQVKEPWTLKRVKNIVIFVVAIVLTCALIWIIPPTRNILINIYEENFIVKSLVDIVGMLINAILSIFK